VGTKTGVDERLVSAIWERQAFARSGLDELRLDVIFRGVPSDAGGPDYQNAILAFGDGSLITGDVEFHVLASDWYRHGHAGDPRYNGVILHVVWTADGRAPVRADGATIPQLVLSRHVEARLLDRTMPPSLHQHPCVAAFARLSTEELHAAIERAGWRRFAERVDRFEAEMESVIPDQVLYAALLEGMGFASNREQFRKLADAVPVSWLFTVPPPDRTAVLLEASGLGGPGSVRPPARLPPGVWRLARLRPGNHPARRIAGVVEVLNRLGTHPADGLTAAVWSGDTPAELRSVLTVSGEGKGSVGAGRADELAASVVLPFVAAYEPAVDAPRALFACYPAPPGNRWTRVMLDLFRQAGHEVKVVGAPRQQGIHQLYTRYCRQEGHRQCPLCGRADPGVEAGARN
jgi:hypothetical protein